jgi:5-methylcytosine-specific restriction endonuclease McrA
MTNYLDLAEIVLRILEKSLSKPKSRRGFSKSTKAKTLERQNYRCNICSKESDVWDFDHIDGDRSNNSLENCQALCPTCHAKKTRKIKQRKLKLSQALRFLRKQLAKY